MKLIYTQSFIIFFYLIIFIVSQGCKTETGQKLNSSEEEKILIERVEEINLAFKECDIERWKH